jgi:hypothetical protein
MIESILTFLLLIGYIGTCEIRAVAVKDCQTRWDVVIGILVPSPLKVAFDKIQKTPPRRRKRNGVIIENTENENANPQ